MPEKGLVHGVCEVCHKCPYFEGYAAFEAKHPSLVFCAAVAGESGGKTGKAFPLLTQQDSMPDYGNCTHYQEAR